jgi:hypothetical protein
MTVSVGAHIACALRLSDANVQCWGANVGYYYTREGNGVAYSDVSMGTQHACAIRASNGALDCWGYSSGDGQFSGTGSLTNDAPPYC